MSLIRWGSARLRLGVVAAALVAFVGAHAACKDTLEKGVPDDAADTDDVDSIHQDANDPPEASTETGGEPRRDSAAPPTPPADTAPPPTDAGPG